MKRNNRSVGIVVILLLLVAVIYGVAAANTDQQRPFKGGTFGWVTSEGVIEGSHCPVIEVNAEGSGEVTHLGAITVVRQHCFTPPDHPAFNGSVMHDGVYEMTAANGDKIWGTYSGELQPTEFGDQGPIRGIITAPSTIDGGTGRFAGATGEYMTTGDYDLVADEGDFVFDGWITY